jgi:two-component system, OmpR family, phosphate regulon sensor histidine kinase PhoR
MRFRTRVFAAALSVTGVTLAVATALVAWSVRAQTLDRIQSRLVAETRLAARLVNLQSARTNLDEEADAVAALIGARVTLVAADGRVVGDSSESGPGLAALENHGARPEIVQARQTGLGIARRYSATVRYDMLYVAVPVRAAESGAQIATDSPAFVRLALPLTEIQQQLRLVGRSALTAAGAGLATALLIAWVLSMLLSRRVDAIAAVARRYAVGDLSRPGGDYGSDEIATVAQVLDHSVQELGQRLDELARDRALMRAILSGMIEGVVVVDAAGRLQLANGAARDMLGLGERDSGRHYLEIVRDPGVASQIGSALDGHDAAGVEIILNRNPDRTFVARAAPVALTKAPGQPGAVLVLYDVTDLKRADRIRRDFVANVSHELRTPLTAIRGYVEALLDEAPGEGPSRKFLDIIERHAARMERLVRDLLRLARLDAGQETLDLAECPVAPLFEDVQADLAPLIERRGHQVTMRVEPGAEAVRADPAKLHDVIRNLVENAVHHTPDRTVIQLSSEPNGDAIRLKVADSGPGIPQTDRQRVFERFYRVDKARARGAEEGGGTGLGLAIVKHLVGLHAGRVEVSDREGGGTVVTVTLPHRPGH